MQVGAANLALANDKQVVSLFHRRSAFAAIVRALRSRYDISRSRRASSKIRNHARNYLTLHHEKAAMYLPQFGIPASEQECTVHVQIEETATGLSQMNARVA